MSHIDKTEYAVKEDIQVSVSIKNNSSYKMEDISIETLLPEGLVLKNGSLIVEDIDLEAGESSSIDVVAQLSEEDKENVDTKPENIIKPSENTTKPVDDQKTSSPQTGDSSSGVFWILLFVVSTIIIVLNFKCKKATKILSLFLCFIMVLNVSPINIFASENDMKAILVDKTISIDGKEYCIKVNVCYKVTTSDDFTDLEDTEVSADDKCILTASKYEVLADTDTEVTFYVNSTLTVPCFELFADGKSTGVLLYDNGDYSGTCDDIPNDGCYTGVYTMNFDVEKDVIFSARATVGETTVSTDDINIFVYYELTDEQCLFMDEVSAKIKEIIEETRLSIPEGTSGETIAEKTSSEIQKYLISLQNEGKIVDIFDDKENYSISFKYVEFGVVCYTNYYKENNDGIPVSDFEGLTTDSIQTLNEQNTAEMSSLDIDIDYITYKEKALFMLYCDENVDKDEDGAGYLLVESSKNIASQLENAGFETELRYSVTVDDFKNIQDYQYVRFGCHGSYLGGLGIDDSPVICTDQKVTADNRKLYSADLKKQRIFDVTTVDEAGKVLGNFYWIHPDFFNFYYDKDPIKANILHVSCCKGAYKKDLVNALVDVGADAVVAFDETVYTKYDCNLWSIIIPRLLDGNTIENAVNSAIDIVGKTDREWYESVEKIKKPKKEIAKCYVFGNKSELLHNTLENGDFDSKKDLKGSNVSDWKKYGDARSIFKLSGIKPISSSKMAIISSGFGSMNDETTSCIYQTFLVPKDANKLEFSYDIVSEEPMEFVGSKYDDFFQVDILSTDGNVLENLSYESVNTSAWYAIDGINFPGGDDTTYHTRWKTVESDAISSYKGQLVVLRFTVKDTGDAIYDTAALIDSVKIK